MGGYFAYWFPETAQTFQVGARDILWCTGSTLKFTNTVVFLMSVKILKKCPWCIHSSALDPCKLVISYCTHPIQWNRHNEKYTSPLKQIIKKGPILHIEEDFLIVCQSQNIFKYSVPHFLLPVSSGRPTTYNYSTLEGQFRGT